MTGNILVLNAGSSSIKLSLYAVTQNAIGAKPHCEGAVDGIGHAARFHAAAAKLRWEEHMRRRFPPCCDRLTASSMIWRIG